MRNRYELIVRLKVENHNWVIYVTDIGQEIHFHKVIAAAQDMGWHTPPKTRCDHVGFGVIQVMMNY